MQCMRIGGKTLTGAQGVPVGPLLEIDRIKPPGPVCYDETISYLISTHDLIERALGQLGF